MDLYDELTTIFEGEDGVLFRPQPKKHTISTEGRLLDSFEEVNNFVRENGRTPDSESNDIKEALLGARLNAIRTDHEKATQLESYDEFGVLALSRAPESLDELFSKDAGLFDRHGLFDVAKLPRNGVVEKSKGDVAERKPVANFASFKKLFEEKQNGLKAGIYKLARFRSVDQLILHGFYVSNGMMCYVEYIGKAKEVFGRQKERLRVIYENGTESNMYLRTLSSDLYENGFIVMGTQEPAQSEPIDDKITGRVYILRSLSDNPTIMTIKDLYKIGVTTTTVAERIKDAAIDPTYLMAPVEVVVSYQLSDDVNPQKVEALIHRFFSEARVMMEITDAEGFPYVPEEWYSVSLPAIEDAIDLIRSGEIGNYIYRNGHIEEIE